MSSTTVAEFATELKKSTETLIEQLKSAGVAKSAASDTLTDSDKQCLLGYLQASHGTASPERKKITLVKKSTSEIKQADATGKARTIQVEVRKKRTFVKRDDGVEVPAEAVAPEPEAPATPLIDNAELARREEEARRQAELIRRQEEELAEKRRQREEQEVREREAVEKAAAQVLVKQKKVSVTEEPSASAVAEAAAQEQVKTQAREKAATESKARADEEVVRAADLGNRRRKAEAEAAAIRSMMSTPAKTAVTRAPAPVKPVAKAGADAAKAGIKGTLHKPAAGTVAA